jgi:hypothetical protein
MQTVVEEHAHQLPAGEVVKLLGSDEEKGLDRFEVEDRLRHFGPNVLTPKEGPGRLGPLRARH